MAGVTAQELENESKAVGIEQAGISKQVESGNNVDRPNGDLHSHCPVYAKVWGVLLVPRRKLNQELLSESLVASVCISLSERDQVMHTIQFPDDPGVGA